MEPPMIGFPGDPGQKAWRRQKRCCCITSKADCKMVGVVDFINLLCYNASEIWSMASQALSEGLGA